MAAVQSFPGVANFKCRDGEEDRSRSYNLGHDFGLDWSASHFQAMTLASHPSIDMELSPDPASYRHAGLEHCMKNPPERRCSIDAPLAWQTGFRNWHGSKSPLPHGLRIPNESSLASQWTRIDQDTSCSGGSTWSPRTSDSRSEADGYMKHQLSPSHDLTGLGIGQPNLAGPLCFQDDPMSYPGPGCAAVISPHDLQQYPEMDEHAEDSPIRPGLHDITTSRPCSPVDSGVYVSYHQPEQMGIEDEAIGSSIQDESKAVSIQSDDDSAMGDSPGCDDDDDYNPKTEKPSHGRRLSQKSTTLKNSTMTPKRAPRARNTTSQTAKPTKIAKKSSKLSVSPPFANRNANLTPCPHCATGFQSDSTLKKHVLASHTRPFICTFQGYGCQSTVGSKNEWKRHINVQHMHLETWRCDIGICAPQSCGSKQHKSTSPSPSGQLEAGGSAHEFDRKDLFTQHLKRMHCPASSASRAEKAKFEGSIEAIQRRCHRKLRDPPANTICPYCTHHPVFDSWDDRIEHVGKHLERGDFDKSKELEDQDLRAWLIREEYLTWNGVAWKLLDTGKKRKSRAEKAVEEGEEDAEGEDE